MAEEQGGFDDGNEQRLPPELVCPLGNICVAGECPGPQSGFVVTGGAFAGRAAFDLDGYPVTWCG